MTAVSDTVVEGIELIIALALMVVLFAVFGYALIRASQVPHPGSLVTALSLLTTLVVVAYIVTESEALIGLAGAGIGGIAGAVSRVYGSGHDSQEHHREDDGNSDV